MPNDELTDLETEGSSERVEEMEDTRTDTNAGPAPEPAVEELKPEAEAVPSALGDESSVADNQSLPVEAQTSAATPDSPLPIPESAPNSPLSPPASDQSTIVNPQSEIPGPAPLPPAEVIEALLFAADAPIKLDRLAELAEVPPETARTVIDGLNANYQETGRTFRVQRVAQGFQLYTMPMYAEFVRRLYQHQYTHRLSRAALEVLAIVAYKQPVTRPEVEQLRGVDCSGPVVTLLERRLIATYGRASRPGNPFLYRTTPEFLRYFGLAGLEDLPRMEEIGDFLARRETEPAAGEPGKAETTASVEKFDSLAMDGGHKDAAPQDAR